MCDYSLMSLSNRLAVCGEELVVHRFEHGTLGMASAAEIDNLPKIENQPAKAGFLARLIQFLYPPVPQQCTAVCVPPGAHLLLRDIPVEQQRKLNLSSDTQEVIFTEIGTTGFRDAVRFPDGTELLLQKLKEGQRVRILALSSEEYFRAEFSGYTSVSLNETADDQKARSVW